MLGFLTTHFQLRLSKASYFLHPLYRETELLRHYNYNIRFFSNQALLPIEINLSFPPLQKNAQIIFFR